MKTGIPIIIAAPSGAGKTSLVKALIESLRNIMVSISHTTRSIRPEEVDGVNYNFVSVDEFEELIEKDAFLEYARVFGNYYGTSKQWVAEQLGNGSDVIFEIDWQGAQQLRKKLTNVASIFILPPSIDILEQRLQQRGQDDNAAIARRMLAAKSEMSHFDEFDYLIVNDKFDVALEQLQIIVKALRLQTVRQQQQLINLLNELI